LAGSETGNQVSGGEQEMFLRSIFRLFSDYFPINYRLITGSEKPERYKKTDTKRFMRNCSPNIELDLICI
jgi:hypothetical protein